MTKILVIGACGQLGSELTLALREKFGNEAVIASDIKKPGEELMNGPFEVLDALKGDRLEEIINEHKITQIYHLAAILSATGEKNPLFAWQLNMDSLLLVLEAARKHKLDKIYWPSSIAVFGPDTPTTETPQTTVMNPNTVYGISKLAGERWCEYYFEKFGVDVRSLRYPGLIGYKTAPGGGTTDYAVDIYYKAVAGRKFECFLREDTYLPMMYMDDAVKATIDLMEADTEKIKVRSSYNISAISFSPKEISESIKKHVPDFTITYNPDFRQKIADSWPDSIDDSAARKDWGWKESFDLDKMTRTILEGLKEETSK
ncbi:MAG: NAD-dependent epimerase/dehydratase family protein [Candidatus Cyclobacteriaceae bacterium M2_1C_046]